ncbi:MAG: hypothetical protein AAF557_20440 [Pseudomonadota bacterium]
MKFCLVQALEQNCLFIRSAGQYDAKHVRQMIKAASSLDFYQRRVTIMYDMRLVHFTLDPAAIDWLVQTLPDVPKHSDTAMVAETDIGFQMISLYAERRSAIPQALGAFRTMDDALKWLRVPGVDDEIPSDISDILDKAFDEEDRMSTGFQLDITRVKTGFVYPTEAFELAY